MNAPPISTRIGLYIVAGLLLLGAVLFGLSWWRERTPSQTVESAVAHEKTIAAEKIAARAETVYVDAKGAAIDARTVYRTRRDTLLRHLTDTVLVKETIARADTLVLRDSIALAKADSVIAGEKKVTSSVRDELKIAQDRLRPPRLAGDVALLVDPIAQVPAGSVTGTLRVIGTWGLVARADYRYAPRDTTGRMRLYFGVHGAF